MCMEEENSGFFVSPDLPAELGQAVPQPLHCEGKGFCDIYRIDRMGRLRVLKCLKPAHREDPLHENLLRKEFEIGYSLSHPNICEYYSFAPVEGLGNCIEMEWVDGRTLEEIITRSPLSAEATDKVVDELCDALIYLHAKQVLLRDLKPSNILVTYTGDHVKLIDFGFSDTAGHSILKTPAGTVDYTAPEVLAGGKADVRSEIYSLGLILFRLGRRYRAVARKCCEKKPQFRYASVSEVKKALHGKGSLLAGLLFIVIVAAMALYPAAGSLLQRIRGGREVPAPLDTLRAPSAGPENADGAPAVPSGPGSARKSDPEKGQKAAPSDPARSGAPKSPAPGDARKSAARPSDKDLDPSVIDELFRQATDLFE